MYSKEQAAEFAAHWLPAWTGNNPENLASFYSDDCYYQDDSIPGGAIGKAALLEHFEKLLGQNPEWIWTQLEGIPLQNGFLNKWHAHIPVGDEAIDCIGVCLVQFNAVGKICRNEVYFDRSSLITKIHQLNAAKP